MKKRLLYLGLIVLFASCVKQDPPEPVGEIKVRFVNAVKSSNPQDMFIRGVKAPNSVALIYGQFSPYYTSTSGDNAFAFADMGTTEGTGNAGIGGKFEIGAEVTVFYFKGLIRLGGNLAAGVKDDDNVVVPGKARVRFVHLNSFLENYINFSVVDGEILTTGIAFAYSSTYFSVNPGSKIKANATGVTDPLIIDANLQAGKNYTIWIDGASEKVLEQHVIIQN
ncbi:MAG TPA: DUF4397 domain-containing protein [Pedobacter sp.]|uniref:DUF4397 domain-containing protein n=1 Tax=Pedobacter sp. TaxID=1411316 RepID=UPI002C24F773|nr:DUF4397 domain-containing protein [Pedobacter sp.]HMI01449.1 DUF4397 domain-containing protein [Pedobacter sp.]